MNVLASVYACSPYDGSERAVGWNWVCELDKSHQLWVITSKVYENDIERYKKSHPDALRNTDFIYVEVPKFLSFWHKGYRGERLYYLMWQKRALKVAKKLIQNVKIDLVHHITYVTCVLPTYMHKLGLPFLYGPVSGGENIPSIIHYPLHKKHLLIETIRKWTQIFFRATPNFKQTMERATLILATTDETKEYIPKKYHYKTQVFQSIVLDETYLDPEPKEKNGEICKILIAGRMIYWKGFELAIWASIKALEKGCPAEITILGDTDDGSVHFKDNLKKLSNSKNIKFVSKVDYNKMKEFYDEFDLLLNCSLRDSGCYVVMEGMARGLPVICVDTGGPKINTTEKNAIKIKPAKLEKMIDETADAICQLVDNVERRVQMGRAARQHAMKQFVSNKRTEAMNQFYRFVVDEVETSIRQKGKR
ncbi:MAG TPA: glycosyltransferase family 4 protein [Ureibacillus sp.]|nr:glycosyltransferase family 4 protein [Ureibacillus sp.]